MRNGDLLADKKHVDGAQVEVVEEGQRREAVVGRMLAGVELQTKALAPGVSRTSPRPDRVPRTYHNGLPFVLDNVA